MTCPLQICVHPAAGFCPTKVLGASELGRCAARPSLFAGAFLRVFRGILVQLRFHDVRGFDPGESAVSNL